MENTMHAPTEEVPVLDDYTLAQYAALDHLKKIASAQRPAQQNWRVIPAHFHWADTADMPVLILPTVKITVWRRMTFIITRRARA